MVWHPEDSLAHLPSEGFVGEAKACLEEWREILVSSGKTEMVSCGPRLPFQRLRKGRTCGFPKVAETWLCSSFPSWGECRVVIGPASLFSGLGSKGRMEGIL